MRFKCRLNVVFQLPIRDLQGLVHRHANHFFRERGKLTGHVLQGDERREFHQKVSEELGGCTRSALDLRRDSSLGTCIVGRLNRRDRFQHTIGLSKRFDSSLSPGVPAADHLAWIKTEQQVINVIGKAAQERARKNRDVIRTGSKCP